MAVAWNVPGLVARLCVLKIRGWDFDGAWDRAFAEYPPRGSDLIAPSDGHQAKLFGEDYRREVSHVEAMRGYCDDAWHGRKPGLAHFEMSMTVDLDLIGWEPEDAVAA